MGWWWWWRTNLSDASTRTHPHTKLHTHLFCCVWQVKAHLSMVMVHHSSMTQHKHPPPPTHTHTSFAHITRFGKVEVFLSTVMVHHPSMTQHKYTPTPTSFAHISYHKVWQGGGGFEHGDGAPSLYDAAHTHTHTHTPNYTRTSFAALGRWRHIGAW